MITSPGTNPVDQYISNHHVALITQPVLAARSRSKKNRIQQPMNTDKDHRDFSNDSPQFISPIHRMDSSSHPKKSTISPSHPESSDSGVDLSLSTNSSVQYPSTHLAIHRPLSALNEDSSPDEGYPEDQIIQPVRLRFPPVSLGRNRSMEDMLTRHSRATDEQQHRSSSFSDERKEKILSQDEKKLKRSSDGALLELYETNTRTASPLKDFYSNQQKNLSKEHSSRSHDPNRSINDFNQKNLHQCLTSRHESNVSTDINNLPSTQTIHRKPNTLTLKPLRKKPQLNPLHDPSLPLTSLRLHHHDEQSHPMTGTTNNSSNQTTPRSIRPFIPQTTKTKISPSFPSQSNEDPSKSHSNHRTNVDKPHPFPLTIQPRPGVLQQMIPFDASPSKTNNLLVRHQLHQTNQFHPTMIPSHNGPPSSTRSTKACLPFISTEESMGNHHSDEQRKTKGSIKNEKFIKEREEKQRSKAKEDSDHQRIHIKIKDTFDSIPFKSEKSQDRLDFNYPFPRSNEEEPNKMTNISRYPPPHHHHRIKPIILHGRYDHEHINDSTHHSQQKKPFSITNARQQEQIKSIDSNPKTMSLEQKTNKDRSLNRPMESGNSFGSDYSHPMHRTSRVSKLTLQTSETPTSLNHRNPNSTSHFDSYRPLNQWSNDQYPWRKTPFGSTSKLNRTQPMNSKNHPISDRTKKSLKPETKEINEKKFYQVIPKKHSEDNHRHVNPSPTSWSHRSEQQQVQHCQPTKPFPNLYVHLSQSSPSATSSEEFLDQLSTTPRTYRLLENHPLPTIQKRDVSTSPLNEASSFTSSRQTQPFVHSLKEELPEQRSRKQSSEQLENPKVNTSEFDHYRLSDRENTDEILDQNRSPSPLEHVPTTKKLQFASVEPSLSVEKEEDALSDDGWSESSADVIYVDERYRIERQKLKSPSSSASSHLTSQQKQQQQQNYSFPIRQQNVLLQ